MPCRRGAADRVPRLAGTVLRGAQLAPGAPGACPCRRGQGRARGGGSRLSRSTSCAAASLSTNSERANRRRSGLLPARRRHLVVHCRRRYRLYQEPAFRHAVGRGAARRQQRTLVALHRIIPWHEKPGQGPAVESIQSRLGARRRCGAQQVVSAAQHQPRASSLRSCGIGQNPCRPSVRAASPERTSPSTPVSVPLAPVRRPGAWKVGGTEADRVHHRASPGQCSVLASVASVGCAGVIQL